MAVVCEQNILNIPGMILYVFRIFEIAEELFRTCLGHFRHLTNYLIRAYKENSPEQRQQQRKTVLCSSIGEGGLLDPQPSSTEVGNTQPRIAEHIQLSMFLFPKRE